MRALRRIGHDLKRKLHESKARILRRLGVLAGDWTSALPVEAAFWENALKEQGRSWSPEEYRKRIDPHSELQEELRSLVNAPVGATVRILDVGAGPLTTLGKRWTGRNLEIIAIDPLADVYDELLRRFSIQPPLRTRFGHGEKLLEYFEPNTFDLAYASNALDHSYDPLSAISQMLTVTKPGHFVYLWHFANEGLHEQYSGLHQWNFNVCKDDFIINDGHRTFSVASHFAGKANLGCQSTTAFNKPVVIAKLRKLPVSELAPA